MLRIIAGTLKGKRINQPDTPLTRPTTDRAKESIFNILNALFLKEGQNWNNHTALDLFAGSGALVFEALSRGATKGVMIEKGDKALATLRDNRDALGLHDRAVILKRDALHLGRASESFSLIFLDPPYAFAQLDKVVENIIAQGWAQANAWFIFELSATAEVPHHNQLAIHTERLYGRVKIVIAQLKIA